MKTNKFIILIIALTFGIVNAVKAQQEEKTVKPMPEALTKPPATDKPTASPVVKQIATDALPATPAPTADAAKTVDMKGMGIKPDMQKNMPIINADRPKTSTIQAEKKAEPAAKPKPLVAPEIEG